MARKKLLTEGEIRQFMKLANLGPIGSKRLSEMGMGYAGARDEEMGDDMPVDDMAPEEGGDEDMEMDMDMDMDADAGGAGMVSMDDFMSALERAIEEVTGEEADVSEEPGEEGDDDMEMGMDMGDEGDMMGGDEDPMMEERDADAMRKKREKMKQREEEEEKAKDKGKKGFNENEELEERAPRMQKRASDHGSAEPGRKFGKPDEEEEDSMASGAGAGKGEKPERYKGSKGRRGSGAQAKGFGGMSEEAIVSEVAKRVAARLRTENNREQMVDQLAERIMKRLTK